MGVTMYAMVHEMNGGGALKDITAFTAGWDACLRHEMAMTIGRWKDTTTEL